MITIKRSDGEGMTVRTPNGQVIPLEQYIKYKDPESVDLDKLERHRIQQREHYGRIRQDPEKHAQYIQSKASYRRGSK